MCAWGGELVATNESTVVPEPFPDAVVVEDGESKRGFPNPPCTDESDLSEVSVRPTTFLISSSRP